MTSENSWENTFKLGKTLLALKLSKLAGKVEHAPDGISDVAETISEVVCKTALEVAETLSDIACNLVDKPKEEDVVREYPKPDYDIALRPDDPDDPETAEYMDDIVVRNVKLFRAEQMDHKTWWMQLWLDDDESSITFHVEAKSKPLSIDFVATDVDVYDNYVFEAGSYLG